ncbi:pro-resilin-like [Macrosteles quadrilineatus]|uniref:pro-resilin-like n=1 Tax=Macrosteles quadrilineatus TaxID=74068 RepID=UPI0023E13FDF|nr:pro-resilin-like [Macrosteles quadrilineatus]
MKVAIVSSLCLCLMWLSLAEARPEPPSSMYGVPSMGYGRGPAGFGGHSGGGADPFAEEANYNFMYEVQDAASGNDFGHMEQRQGEVARGSYHVLLPDGRMQKVDYVADQNGYRPMVSYTGEAKFGPSGGNRPSGGGGGYFYRR